MHLQERQSKSVTVPSSVVTVGAMAFSECQYLETVRYGGKVISDRMFVRCTKLKNLTLTRNVKEIVGGCFNYCESLNQITYEGSLADWNAVKKNTNWDSHAVISNLRFQKSSALMDTWNMSQARKHGKR